MPQVARALLLHLGVVSVKPMRILGPSLSLALIVASSCGGRESGSAGVAEMQAPVQEEHGETWYALRRDAGSCTPECRWFADALNLHEADRRFERIELGPAHLREMARVAALESPDGDLVVRAAARGSTLAASEVFRAFPGTLPSERDIYVRFESRSMASCEASTCERVFAVQLNARSDAAVPDVDLSLVEAHWVDHAWLENLVLDEGAVVAGRYMGEPGGRGIVRFQVNRVFAPLAGRLAACPAVVKGRCGPGKIQTYTRDGDRCLVPSVCARPSDCPTSGITCAPGYVLRSWRAPPRGCPGYACDPIFLAE